jgi:hypothetical protein
MSRDIDPNRITELAGQIEELAGDWTSTEQYRFATVSYAHPPIAGTDEDCGVLRVHIGRRGNPRGFTGS